jgi:hypothetical protein
MASWKTGNGMSVFIPWFRNPEDWLFLFGMELDPADLGVV